MKEKFYTAWPACRHSSQNHHFIHSLHLLMALFMTCAPHPTLSDKPMGGRTYACSTEEAAATEILEL